MNKILIEVRQGVIQNIITTGENLIYAVDYDNVDNNEEFFTYYDSRGDQQLSVAEFDAIINSIEDDLEIPKL